MKLKSLLLGSAAVLALSTGAQAADPIAEFVSLGVCDAYGITGLTIESDDTCLSISGSVDYSFENANYGDGFGEATDFFTDSTVEFSLLFEATTQTDAGAAMAVIRLNDGSENDNGDINPEIEQAYVSFGDTTVLSAGRKGSIFDTVILDRSYGALNFDELDKGDLPSGGVATGGHVIQVESLIADGFSVLVGLENLQVDQDFADNAENGTAGLAVAYDNGGISGELGVLLGDIFGDADDVNYYARVMADFDAFSVRGGVVADDAGDWIATIGAGATFDMFSLDIDAAFVEDEFAVAGEGSFAATDTIDVYIGAAYAEAAGIMNATYYDNGDLVGETFAVYGGVDAAVTETIAVNAEVGYVDYSAGDLVYGAGGVTYAPGGDFETGLDVYADTDEVYAVTFSASKAF